MLHRIGVRLHFAGQLGSDTIFGRGVSSPPLRQRTGATAGRARDHLAKPLAAECPPTASRAANRLQGGFVDICAAQRAVGSSTMLVIAAKR